MGGSLDLYNFRSLLGFLFCFRKTSKQINLQTEWCRLPETLGRLYQKHKESTQLAFGTYRIFIRESQTLKQGNLGRVIIE